MKLLETIFPKKPEKLKIEMATAVGRYMVTIPVEVELNPEGIRESLKKFCSDRFLETVKIELDPEGIRRLLEEQLQKNKDQITKELDHRYRPPEIICQSLEALLNPYPAAIRMKIESWKVK